MRPLNHSLASGWRSSSRTWTAAADGRACPAAAPPQLVLPVVRMVPAVLSSAGGAGAGGGSSAVGVLGALRPDAPVFGALRGFPQPWVLSLLQNCCRTGRHTARGMLMAGLRQASGWAALCWGVAGAYEVSEAAGQVRTPQVQALFEEYIYIYIYIYIYLCNQPL